MDKLKATFIAVFTALSAWLGVLAIPVLLLVAVNIIDYGTGLAAAKYRGQKISSYVGFRGIAKKICMWLLVALGAFVDILITYGTEQAGITLSFGYAVASLVAVWLICNEIISILENIKDIGVALPPFLLKIVDNLKSQVESKAEQSLPADRVQQVGDVTGNPPADTTVQ
jgi:toxin secretion/phage lysis holin